MGLRGSWALIIGGKYDVVMIKDELNSFRQKWGILDHKSNEYILELFEQIIDNNPFLYEPAIGIIISKIYSEEDRFVRLLCKLIENTSSDLAFDKIIEPIKEIALRQQEKTLAIANKMINIGIRPGICSGIIISPLLGRDIVDKEMILNLKSNDPVLQRYSLVAICNSFLKRDEKIFKLFIPNLLKVAENVNLDNTDILIQCLIRVYLINKDSVLPILEREIEQRGYVAAATYLRTTRYEKELPISLLKKALHIIEVETPESEMIDDALGRIYEEDQSFVVERLRERLREGGIRLAGTMLEYNIKRVGPSPVIQMLEEEIDNGNLTMINVGESILKNFVLSKQEWLEWCKKWKDDKKKEIIVLRSLAEILTDLMSYQPSPVRDDAITLVKEFTKKKGLDYDKETKGINFGKDSNEGRECKEATIKALHIINQILNPTIQIDTEVLKRNLKNYPYLSKAIGADWLVGSSKSKSPHLLAYIYGEERDYDRMEELAKEFESEKDEKKRLLIAWQYEFLAHALPVCSYWEQVFKTLDEYKLKIPESKLRSPDNADSVLTEAEVLARLAPNFKVELEPDIEELRPKKLDARIEFNGVKALIEVAVVNEKIELDVAHGGISLPGGKVKNVLLNKLKGQLKKGEVDPKVPVILVLYLHNVLDGYEVENAIYGQLQFHWKTRTDKHQVVEEGPTRASNSFYEVKNSDIVTAIAAYKRDYTKNDPLIGRLYRPPYHINPRNPLGREFRLKLRNALFGNSENSLWQTLMKIEGINEELAKKLHFNGIEDIDVLASVKGDELIVDGFTNDQLLEFQKEAIRVVYALQTDSIRFLKGIDQNTYDTLTKKEIHLITQLTKLTEIPEGIDSSIWSVIIDDAKRIILQNGEIEISSM